MAEKNRVWRCERDEFGDALDIGDEAHVEHAIGFVDNEDVDPCQQQFAALEVIEKSPGRGDQHIGSALQLAVLLLEGNAADQQSDVKLVVLAVGDEIFLDLGGQLTRRLEDQCARHASAGTALFQLCQHRQHEGSGLARPGLCDTKQVAAAEGRGDGPGLNRGRCRVSGVFYCRKHFLA